MNCRMRLRSLNKLLTFLLLGLNIFVLAQLVPAKPAKIFPVTDDVGLLTPSEREQLNQKLIKFHDSTSTEIAVIIIPTTKGEDINYLATGLDDIADYIYASAKYIYLYKAGENKAYTEFSLLIYKLYLTSRHAK